MTDLPPIGKHTLEQMIRQRVYQIAAGYACEVSQAALTKTCLAPTEKGEKVKFVNLEYQAGSWDRSRRVVAKIEWHLGELFPRYYFIVTHSKHTAS